MSTSDKDLRRLIENLENHEGRLRRLETQEIGVGVGGIWTLIEHKLLGSDVVSVSFTSIPSTYKHLALFSTCQQDSATLSNVPIHMRINADSGSNYLWDTIHSSDSGGHPVTTIDDSSIATNDHWRYMFASYDAADKAGSALTIFPHYSSTIFEKNMFSLAFNLAAAIGSQVVGIFGCVWEDTVAINEIGVGFFSPATLNLKTNSQFTLYGIN